MAPSFVFLRIFFKDQLSAIKQFDQEQIIIGNHTDAHLELKDASVFSFHTIIAQRDETYRLIDLGSSHGTFKNGERITESPLTSQDKIQIGLYTIEFFIGIPNMTAQTSVPEDKKPVSPPSSSTLTQSSPHTRIETMEENPSSSAHDNLVLQQVSQTAPQASTSTQPQTPPTTTLSSLHHTSPQNLEQKSSSSTDDNLVTPKSLLFQNFKKETPPTRHQVNSDISTNLAVKEEISTQITNPISVSPKTFAPPSAFKDLREIIQPGKGTVIEVIVAWRERVLKTYHFHKKSSITIGYGEDADIQIPLLNVPKDKFTLIKVGALATVHFTREMTGYYTFKNKSVTPFPELTQSNMIKKSFSGQKITVQQGEMVQLGLQNDLISIYIRYVPRTTEPVQGSFFPFNALEMMGFVFAALVSLFLSFYIGTYTPSTKDVKPLPPIKAYIDWKKIKKPPLPPLIAKPKLRPKPPKLVKVTPKVQKKPVQKKRIPPPSPPSKKLVKKKTLPTKVPKPRKRKPKPTLVTAQKKTPIAPPTPVAKKRKNPSQLGLLGVLGSKGTQSKLSQIYSGSSNNIDKIVRSAKRNSKNQSPSILSKNLRKNDRISKRSLETVGIGKVGIKSGRKEKYAAFSSSLSASKRSTSFIDYKGKSATFSGSIDRNGIRNIIRRNRGLIKSCYDTALNKNERLEGKLVLRWDIEEDGSVSRAGVVSNSIGDKKMASCILNRLRTWRFPVPPRGQIGRVTGYPFVFTTN